MAGRRKRPSVPRSSRAASGKPPKIEYLLEQGTLRDIRRAKEHTAEWLEYQWRYYSELAHQRNQILDELKAVLIQASFENYQFEKWQRAVKWKYSLHPLSTIGSLSFIGGRFNTGKDVNPTVQSFPALYLAADKDTALQETLGHAEGKDNKLSAIELALTNPQSQVIVSVSGQLEKVFDLRVVANLKTFVHKMRRFTLSAVLKETAKHLGMDKPRVIQTPGELLDTLLVENWRAAPAVGDVPANSQIFGHLVYQAGIEGILYPSRHSGKDCLAIFPRNFANTSSYIELDDEPPDLQVPRRIDGTTWRLCDLSPKELIEGKLA